MELFGKPQEKKENTLSGIQMFKGVVGPLKLKTIFFFSWGRFPLTI